MIIGDITVYKCDDETCDIVKVVESSQEPAFREDWFVGLTKHFCLGHKESVRNAATIAAEEEDLERMKSELLFRIDVAPSHPHALAHSNGGAHV